MRFFSLSAANVLYIWIHIISDEEEEKKGAGGDGRKTSPVKPALHS